MNRLKILIAMLILVPVLSSAQPKSIDKIFEKYSGKKGFVTVDLSDPSMLAGLVKDKSKQGEINRAIEGWEAIKILVYEWKDGVRSSSGESFKNDVKNISDLDGFKDFISVNNEDSYVRMMSKKVDENRQELLVLVAESKSTVIIWIKGDVNMKDASRVGEILKGMKENK